MDLTAVKKATDGELRALGVVRRGDILALKAFAEKDSSQNVERNDKKRTLLEALKSKFAGKKNTSKATKKEPEKLHHKSTDRKVEVGWRHFDSAKNRHIAVRMAKGGGSRTISVPLNASVEELLVLFKNVFFPESKCFFGEISQMKFTLASFKCEEIGDKDFTVLKYMEHHKLSKIKFYLLSSRLEGNEIIPVSDSDDELPCMFESPCDSPSTSKSSLIGSTEERKCSKEQQDAEFLASLEKDEVKDLQKRKELQQLQEKAMEQENLRRARKRKVPSEPDPSDPHVQVSVRHLTLGVQTRKFSNSCEVSAVYNWIGSLNPNPEHFTLSMCGIPILDPALPITVVDRSMVNMAEYEAAPFADDIIPNCEEMPEIQSLENTQQDSTMMNSIPLVTEVVPALLLEDDS